MHLIAAIECYSGPWIEPDNKEPALLCKWINNYFILHVAIISYQNTSPVLYGGYGQGYRLRPRNIYEKTNWVTIDWAPTTVRKTSTNPKYNNNMLPCRNIVDLGFSKCTIFRDSNTFTASPKLTHRLIDLNSARRLLHDIW